MSSPILRDDASGVVVDLHRAPAAGDTTAALAAMTALDGGAVANMDERRMVGHYWLRNPDLAPTAAIRDTITATLEQIRAFAPGPFKTLVQIGVGGSALGPELANDALRGADAPEFEVLDTVDPVAVSEFLARIDPEHTLVIVASKSGSTIETSIATDLVEAHFERCGVSFADRAIAVTIPGSRLAERARDWKATFPMFDWVGGRTSVCSAVGLLPMHLLGIDIDAFIEGAAAMDAWNRCPPPNNPAAHIALLWTQDSCNELCVIPYAHRLRHLSRYLQQLIMESLGKANDRDGRAVHTGLTVYGNKGSADQHAIVQQLRDGPAGVHVHLIDVAAPADATVRAAADVQFALHAGTGDALAEVGRPVVSISLPRMDARALGGLIALYERAVGLAAELLNINAYNQPGVEAGKKAASVQLAQLDAVYAHLNATGQTAQQLSDAAGISFHRTWRLAGHLVATGRARATLGKAPSEDRFEAVENSSK
ncbi:MAG: glucose-6-phosphate isomerase [Myxococcota bacterium]|nr:glucose-6-phosphate isomerase [Myxococcota bacterium]